MIFIPAFSQLSHLSTQNMDTILSWIVTNHQSGVPITAICTGVFLLAETGLLDGRTATTNWQFARLFQRKYPNVQLKPERIMTEAKGIICTGAASAVFDMSLHLIRRFGGKTLAANCAKALLIDPNRQSQAPYMVFRSTKDHKDEKILKAQHWFEENYGRTGSIDAVAKQMGISPRHFKRRFRKATGVPPLVYLQNVRIEMAKQKLENTRKSVNEITYCIGYEDSSTFRKLFKRETGLSPAEYRKKFCWKGGL
jgi:transcriptional regulator GlxA family with amidase domain